MQTEDYRNFIEEMARTSTWHLTKNTYESAPDENTTSPAQDKAIYFFIDNGIPYQRVVKDEGRSITIEGNLTGVDYETRLRLFKGDY